MLIAFCVLLAIWAALVGLDPASLVVALPTCLLAGYAYSRLSGPRGAFILDPLAALRFFPYFMAQTLMGTINVAWMALNRQAAGRVGVCYEYRTRLQHPSARLLFINCVSMLPGTLVVAFQEGNDNTLIVHSIDALNLGREELARCEGKIAAIFKESLGEVSCI